MGGCIAKPPREMRSDSGEPMGHGFRQGGRASSGSGGCRKPPRQGQQRRHGQV